MNQGAQLVNLDSPYLYINRELSWIEFNRRVFEQAQDERHPLLERVKFISIFETNLDEYIMIRLAGIKDQTASTKTLRSPDGRTAEDQLKAIREQLNPLIKEVRTYWRNTLLPLLAEQRIYVFDYEQLNEQQRQEMQDYYKEHVFPILTPLAFEQGNHFPQISNLSLNLAVVVNDAKQKKLYARVKVPPVLPKLVPIQNVGEGVSAFVWIEQVIAANLHSLFIGYKVCESYPFRVIRDADVELQADESPDLLKYVEQEVRDRRLGRSVVNLAINPSMPGEMQTILVKNLRIKADDVTVIDGPLSMAGVMELYSLNRPELKDEPFVPYTPAFLQPDADMFSAIRNRDILLHHPYDSFNSVVNFINAAAKDEQVQAIKQSLYRVGSNAAVVKALLDAAANGKEVSVLVELKARFDEENNIGWARELESAGVHVVFGKFNLKTHAKVALVVRNEGGNLVRYLHLGTGNYNASTAKIYEDLGLFTYDTSLWEDATNLFNSLTGYALGTKYDTLLVAPDELRPKFAQLIEREIRLHKKHGNGRLIFKFNALTDAEMIQALYRASIAGVEIDLIVRGMCSLRPGVKDISENIRVRSVVGRFLEHSRIYYFGNSGQPEVYLGSADLMPRNLDDRVETLFPIKPLDLRETIYEKILGIYMRDTINTNILQEDGSYIRPSLSAGEEAFDCQQWFVAHRLFAKGEGTSVENLVVKTKFSEADL